jgi:hypothetical protein
VTDASGLDRTESLMSNSPDLESVWSYAVGPVNAYALMRQRSESSPLIAVGRRGGLLMLINPAGKLVRNSVVAADIRGLAAAGKGRRTRLAAATEQGIMILDRRLRVRSSIELPDCGAVAWLTTGRCPTVAAMTDHGEVAVYRVR